MSLPVWERLHEDRRRKDAQIWEVNRSKEVEEVLSARAMSQIAYETVKKSRPPSPSYLERIYSRRRMVDEILGTHPFASI